MVYGNVGSASALAGGVGINKIPAPPAQPGRFTALAGHLEDRIGWLEGIASRLERVADGLAGPVPEDPQTGKARGEHASTAERIANSLDDFNELGRRVDRVLERLEAL